MLSARRLLVISRPLGYLPALAVFGFGWHEGTAARSGWQLLVLAAYFTVPFGLIAYGSNDIADRHSDAHNPRKGGLDGAYVRDHEVAALSRWIGGCALIFPVLLLLARQPAAALTTALLALVAVAYSMPPLRLKTRPGLDSLANALGIILIFLTGVWFNSGFNDLPVPDWSLLVAIAAFTVSFHALGAVIDYDVDRQVHDRTIAQAAGKPATLLLCAGLFGLSLGLAGRNHFLTGLYLMSCIVLTLAATVINRPAFTRRAGLIMLITVPLAILPALL